MPTASTGSRSPKRGRCRGCSSTEPAARCALASVKIEDKAAALPAAAGRQQAPGTSSARRSRAASSSARPWPRDRTINLIGVRPPKWPAAQRQRENTLSASLSRSSTATPSTRSACRPRDGPISWAVEDGVDDQRAAVAQSHVEAEVQGLPAPGGIPAPTGSNSGIYLRGRYELQVLDDFGKPAEKPGHMAIYGVDASARQRQQASRRMADDGGGARRQPRHRDAQRPESARQRRDSGDHRRRARRRRDWHPGPLLIQGDHTKVWFRNHGYADYTRPSGLSASRL